MTPVERCPVCDKPAGPLHPWAVAAGYVIGISISVGVVVVVAALAVRAVSWAVKGAIG